MEWLSDSSYLEYPYFWVESPVLPKNNKRDGLGMNLSLPDINTVCVCITIYEQNNFKKKLGALGMGVLMRQRQA